MSDDEVKYKKDMYLYLMFFSLLHFFVSVFFDNYFEETKRE